MMDLQGLRYSLLGISVFRDALSTPVVRASSALLDALCSGRGEGALSAYAQLFYTMQQGGFSSLGEALAQALLQSSGPYPLAIEQGRCTPALEAAARQDVAVFSALAQLPCSALLSTISTLLGPEGSPAAACLPRWEADVPFTFESLTEQYRLHGAGLFAQYRAFVWEHGALVGIARPDCPPGSAIWGYERQRREVERNTRILLSGHPANNVLLYGESGSGKSATVKNLLTLPGTGDLRIIEADKSDLSGLPALLRTLDGRRQKFIIFIDDLAFDRDDAAYSILKTILEGGLERRPDNVAVYATSNRRHLVRQTFSDRAGDEVDRSETIQEKTSLADRFGLRVLFQGLTKPEYLALIDLLAARHGVDMDAEELHRQAIIWERLHAGQTPRTALQFILSLPQA